MKSREVSPTLPSVQQRSRPTQRGRGRICYIRPPPPGDDGASEASAADEEVKVEAGPSIKPAATNGAGGEEAEQYEGVDTAEPAVVEEEEPETHHPAAPPLLHPAKPAQIVSQRYVVRPAPPPSPPRHLPLSSGSEHQLPRYGWMLVFGWLPRADLARCLQVCRTWNRWVIHRSLWPHIALPYRRMVRDILVGIVRRQPRSLDLSHTNISRAQLSWLIARLPQLQRLTLEAASWHAISALCCSACPLLSSLNISWSSDLRDQAVKSLVLPPRDHRPGIDERVSRLHFLSGLHLAGADITVTGLSAILDQCPQLRLLDLSYCARLTDDALSLLVSRASQLRHLDLTGCHALTNAALPRLLGLPHLNMLCLLHCHLLTEDGINVLIAASGGKLQRTDECTLKSVDIT